jgi:signal peptidase I
MPQSKYNSYFIVLVFLFSCDTIKKGHEIVFNRYRISSPSMSPALKIGETFSVISTDSISRNNIVAYHPPKEFRFQNDNVLWVSRVVGLPGDTLEMRNANLFINGSPYPFTLELKHAYVAKTSMRLNEKRFDGIDFDMIGADEYVFYVTSEELKQVKTNKAIIEIFPKDPEEGTSLAIEGENADNWGPVTIPKYGDTVKLVDLKISHFARLVKEYEQKANSSALTYVVTKKDYYFLISDNRHNALDSRYTGFVPADHIEGVVLDH